MDYDFSKEYAAEKDRNDPLAKYREQFIIPVVNNLPALYFTGNSLGLQAVKTKEYVLEELEDWGKLGVEGHTEARRPWLSYHELFSSKLAKITGADPDEVVAMNGLTTNLHLLMVSFFSPEGKRTKIVCEGKAFPSDRYALRSQLRFHGLDPDEHLIEVQPDPVTGLISEKEILDILDRRGEEIALLMFGGVNYYTGQVFNMKEITAAAHAAGALAGWDLAHAAGNIILDLHNWDVDFAAWCGYKYLNSGPGGVSGVFIHKRHHGKTDIPRFEGWWGHDKKTRFKMPEDFVPINTAEAWQLSNAPVLSMTPLLASLELFEEATMPALRKKSEELTAYLEYVIQKISAETNSDLRSLTPGEMSQRGCQISMVVPGKGREVFDKLSAGGVIADWREPDVIRLAPVPLYNSFMDIYLFGKLLKEILE